MGEGHAVSPAADGPLLTTPRLQRHDGHAAELRVIRALRVLSTAGDPVPLDHAMRDTAQVTLAGIVSAVRQCGRRDDARARGAYTTCGPVLAWEVEYGEAPFARVWARTARAWYWLKVRGLGGAAWGGGGNCAR